jgi:hypothetical protein
MFLRRKSARSVHEDFQNLQALIFSRSSARSEGRRFKSLGVINLRRNNRKNSLEEEFLLFGG